MTKDEMDILRDIARSLERIADHLTKEHVEEKSISELCETCYYKNYPDICREREFNMKNGYSGEICYSKEWNDPRQYGYPSGLE